TLVLCFCLQCAFATLPSCARHHLPRISAVRLQGGTVWLSIQARRFKLNYATHSRQPDGRIVYNPRPPRTQSPEYSIFVGDLTPEVDNFQLYDFFVRKYPSCMSGKVITDQNGVSRGYGFVRFAEENEQKKALGEMQGATGLGSRPVKISLATPKKYLPFLKYFFLFLVFFCFVPSPSHMKVLFIGHFCCSA
uniref:tRNA selenocysteine-associated protein 1 n=1 Tax=Eptatretus burgeri TaxID=7764 RepID=A0A8C4NP79_EPTBU